MADIARHVLIAGRVQGVGYRVWAWREGLSLGLRGWVRNLPDARVEMVAAGPEEVVEAMLRACGRGPDHARVTGVEATPCADEGLGAFEIRRG
jgi:acylphosphatase